MSAERSDPKPQEGWSLRCRECGRGWPKTDTMADVQEHFKLEHDTNKVTLNLAWTGHGPTPKPPPSGFRGLLG